mmetsp:Transcript_26664/g.38227  ORF Transcript_26664/g.38227 Transcript_26664/m.38227 type:complete len:106 (-) Transcript_26664:47-364(-)
MGAKAPIFEHHVAARQYAHRYPLISCWTSKIHFRHQEARERGACQIWEFFISNRPSKTCFNFLFYRPLQPFSEFLVLVNMRSPFMSRFLMRKKKEEVKLKKEEEK